MVEIQNLFKTYTQEGDNVEALKGVDLHIETGEVYGVIGLSGAGKSSLVRCICGLETVDSGAVLINGKDITSMGKNELREERRKIGMVFQHFNLLKNATVYENIAFPLEIAHWEKSKVTQRVNEVLEMVELTEKKDAYPAMLSGGQKQRVGIARALAGFPDLLICDEATSALDPNTTKSILKLLKEINQKLGLTILVITHEMVVIKDLCQKVAILEDGKIAESGNTLDICVRPKTKLGKSFFDEEEKWLEDVDFNSPSLKDRTLLKATFVGSNTTKSLINDMIRTFDVDVAILSGKIEFIGETSVGNLVLDIKGDDNQMAQVMSYLHSESVLAEVIVHES